MPRAQKGQRFGGRQKGTPNKVSGAVRQLILDSLIAVGGVEYLKELSRVNSSAYASLVGRALPKEVDVQADSTITISWATTKEK